MEKDYEETVPREPWQRLLREGADTPPETTDARIRAAARRVLASRRSRWLLPASLAASFLLAVTIVQMQSGDDGSQRIDTENNVAARLRRAEAPAAESARAGDSVPTAPAARRQAEGPAAADTEEQEFVPEPEASGSPGDMRVTGTRIGGPEQDLKAASEMAEAAVLADEDPSPSEDDSASAREPRAAAAPSPESTPVTALTITAVRKPEDWYTEVEKLRAAGRIDEADRELEKLKAAHPGWLEKHLQEEERR